ncbi:UNVERIFIED_CONTAM: hypothetical protein GTU68_006058, partial [Idotea baltica]|nr:hypothetical protein [Idotea baltica]
TPCRNSVRYNWQPREGLWCHQEHASPHRVHPGRSDVLRDEGRLRSLQGGKELGDRHRWNSHPDAEGLFETASMTCPAEPRDPQMTWAPQLLLLSSHLLTSVKSCSPQSFFFFGSSSSSIPPTPPAAPA